jgi:hypothetical protein
MTSKNKKCLLGNFFGKNVLDLKFHLVKFVDHLESADEQGELLLI